MRTRYLVVDSTALLCHVAQSGADRGTAFPARHLPELLDDNGVVAELGTAHEGSLCSLGDRENSAVLDLSVHEAG